MANSRYPVPIGRAGSGSSARLIQAHEKGYIPHTVALIEEWRCDFDILLAGTLDEDTTQEFDLHDYIADNPTAGILFPANVVRCSPCKVWVELEGDGATTIAVEVGDTGDPNGLLTTSNVHNSGSGVWLASTPSAAEYARRIESAYIPTLSITTTTENVDDLTAFRCTILIPFIKLPLVS